MSQSQDSFVRANQSGWGTASDGETWVKIAGASPTLAIASNTGTWTGVTGSATYALGTNTFTDVEVSVRLKITNAGDSVGIFARSDGTAANFYRAFAQNTTLTLSKTVAGVTTSLNTTAITFNTATLYWMKLRVIGTGVYAKFWADGSGEPTTWTLSSSDTAVTSAGRFGVRTSLNATTDTASIDTFTANQLTPKDIATRFLLMSANQLKDIASRFRLMSANQLKDVTSRFRLMSANQLKDVAARFRLMSANQPKDIASRFRLRSADQLRDIASRFRLMSASQLKDVVTRFRLMSASQVRDIATRFRFMSANQLRDIASRFRLQGYAARDIATRFCLYDGRVTLVTARGRDGLVTASGRDGIVIARGRDGIVTGRGR